MSHVDDFPIRGSPTCAETRYLSVVNGQLIGSTEMRDVLAARYAAGAPIEVDHAAVSHLLHDGFVPQPRTIYRDIHAISVDLAARHDGAGLAFRRAYPYPNRASSLRAVPSPATLLQCLAGGVTAACEDSRNPILLLSAGVDSTSVAVAAKEAGRDDLLCVTYGESDSDFEVNFARATCAKLGLRHAAHLLNPGDRRLQDVLRQYAGRVAEPCADPATIAVISAITDHTHPGSVVLDGSGSDFFFWRPPKPFDLLKTHLGFGQSRLLRKLRPLIPMHVRRERILATPLELLLLHGAWLRHSETRAFHAEAVDTHEYWLSEFLENCPYPREEMQHCLKMVYMGPSAYMMKTRNAADGIGAAARFPWSAPSVAEYCFNLPEEARFDRQARRSKVIVRQMLAETIGYDSAAVGKRYFAFGKAEFLRRNIDFCREEILSCALWSPAEMERSFARLEELLDSGQPVENALLSLVMVSLWHNHWFAGSMRDYLDATQLRSAHG